VLPGKTYLLTRRCSERRFFLRPDRVTMRVLLYCLAVAAARFHIVAHAFVVMSNHIHLVVTDLGGQLPKFEQMFFSLVARALNVHLGRSESFWAPRDPSDRVEALDPEVALTQLVYVLANPVKAGLVRSARQWPGLWSDPARMGGKGYTVERPRHFFSAEGDMPERVTLRVERLEGFGALSDAEYRARVESRLEEVEETVRGEYAESGRPFLGKARVLKTKRFEAARSKEEKGRKRREVAATDPEVQKAGELEYAEFRHEYDRALERYRGGDHGVEFPAGTYKLRVELAVNCRAPPVKQSA
jgi:putative transposase